MSITRGTITSAKRTDLRSTADIRFRRESTDPDFGVHRQPDEDFRELAGDELTDELELLMTTNGGFDPGENQWLRWDHRDPNPDKLEVGTTKPSVRCWTLAA